MLHPTKTTTEHDRYNQKIREKIRVAQSTSAVQSLIAERREKVVEMVLSTSFNRAKKQFSDSSTTTADVLLCGMLCSDSSIRSSSSSSRSSTSSDYHEASIYAADEYGDLPLHRALSEYSLLAIADPDDVPRLEKSIRTMARAWPESIDVFNEAGLTALHIACMEGASLPVILDLINAMPTSVGTATRNKRRMLPLHLVCRYYSGPTATMYKILQFLLKVNPNAAKIPTGTGELALHLCCQNHFCTVLIVDLLVKAYPEALKIGTQNKKRQLPLHLACERRYFRRLESSKSSKKKGGSTCSEVSSSSSCSSDMVIRFLVRKYAESVTIYDTKGELPLHTAIRGYQSDETVKFLLSVFPESIQFVEDTGRTALHICVACAMPDMAILQLLLQADATATTVVDDHGKTPLQYAAQGKLDLLYTLIQSSPSIIQSSRTNE